MVSIPALPKHPELTEDVPFDWAAATPPPFTEMDPQPYREVKPGDPDYENGVYQASKRLAAYRAGPRDKNYCPDTTDIVDLDVERSNGNQLIPLDAEVSGLPKENVPDRPHWITVDLTNPPGAWNPRRTDWKKILVDQDFSDEDAATTADRLDALAAQKRVVKLLQDVTLPTQANDFLHQEVPFGIWRQKSGCSFDKIAKVGDFKSGDTAHPRPRWMDIAKNTPDGTAITADSPVYSALPGSLVFNMICVNCHGADADSGGRQAQTLAEMTGGTARVANFRVGLFGPFGTGGENRKAIFGSDDVAARYLPWMALGGTKVRIPTPILNLVANTPVLGEPRKNISVTSANMLQTAQALCRLVGQLPAGSFDWMGLGELQVQAHLHAKYGQLLTDVGDAELWTRLCTLNNPPPIHVLTVAGDPGSYFLQVGARGDYFAKNFPANAPVGDSTGQIRTALTADNDSPWCVAESADAGMQTWLHTQVALKAPGASASDAAPKLPICPAEFVKEANHLQGGANDISGKYVYGDIDDWAARGAINAGQAVFVYLDRMISQGKGRDLRYDECEQLGK